MKKFKWNKNAEKLKILDFGDLENIKSNYTKVPNLTFQNLQHFKMLKYVQYSYPFDIFLFRSREIS